MERLHFLRWVAKWVGRMSHPLGLDRIDFLHRLYQAGASFALPDRNVCVPMDGQRMWIPNPRRHALGRMIYLHGVWEEVVTRELCALAKPGMTVLDVGAHVGYFTLLLARRVAPRGRVLAFEPNFEVRTMLEENIRRNNHSHVTIFPFALFCREGEGHLRGYDNLNTFLSPAQASSETAVPMVVFDKFAGNLDLRTLDLIKMDVEGAEYDILLGMRQVLEKYHPTLVLEAHRDGLVKFGHTISALWNLLESYGYQMQPVWRWSNTVTVVCTPSSDKPIAQSLAMGHLL
jgi:FkbM family methyltransferase